MIRERPIRTLHEAHEPLRQAALRPDTQRRTVTNALDRCLDALDYAARVYEQQDTPDKYHYGLLGQQLALAAFRDFAAAVWAQPRLTASVHHLIATLDRGHTIGHRPRLSNDELGFRAAVLAAVYFSTARGRMKKAQAIVAVAKIVHGRVPTGSELDVTGHANAKKVEDAVKAWDDPIKAPKNQRIFRDNLIREMKAKYRNDRPRAALEMMNRAVEMAKRLPSVPFNSPISR